MGLGFIPKWAKAHAEINWASGNLVGNAHAASTDRRRLTDRNNESVAPTLVANFLPYVVGSPICVSLLQQVAGIDVRIRRDTENGQATDRHRKIKGECAVLNSILGASVQ